MVKSKRRRHSSEFKFKVAVEALKGDWTMAELSSRFELQSTQLQQWKKMLLDEGALVFERGLRTVKSPEPDTDANELHRKIGERTMERDFLKEKLVPWIDLGERR